MPSGYPAGAAEQVVLLRELFNNPFNPVKIANAWLTANVVTLARAIHANRAFVLMPVLGDALQEAGCHRQTSSITVTVLARMSPGVGSWTC